MLSDYCKNIVDKYNIKVDNVKILIPNLYNKIKYPIHYENLQYSLKLGMKLIKIHRILSFKQKNWLKIFIDFNTKKIQQSTGEFIKICTNFLIIVSMAKVSKIQQKKIM